MLIDLGKAVFLGTYLGNPNGHRSDCVLLELWLYSLGGGGVKLYVSCALVGGGLDVF